MLYSVSQSLRPKKVPILSPGRALLVAIDSPPERDGRLPMQKHPNLEVYFEPLQVWGGPGYARYRKAYICAKRVEAA